MGTVGCRFALLVVESYLIVRIRPSSIAEGTKAVSVGRGMQSTEGLCPKQEAWATGVAMDFGDIAIPPQREIRCMKGQNYSWGPNSGRKVFKYQDPVSVHSTNPAGKTKRRGQKSAKRVAMVLVNTWRI